jgi:hypothetical protein
MLRMQQILQRSFVIYGSFALALVVTACGGGGSGGGSLPSAAPSTSASASSSPSTSPSTSPSSNPTSAAQTWTFGGSSTSGSFAAGTTPAAVTLAAYHGIGVTVQFVAPSSGSGTLQFSDALNGALGVNDVTPNTLPADNATAGYTPIIYLSTYNGGTGAISFGTAVPQVTVSDTSLNGTYTTCNLDVYGQQGNGNTNSWFSVGTTGSVTASGVVVGPGTLGGGSTVDFKPGQVALAISCH